MTQPDPSRQPRTADGTVNQAFQELGCEHDFGVVYNCPTCGTPRHCSTNERVTDRVFFEKYGEHSWHEGNRAMQAEAEAVATRAGAAEHGPGGRRRGYSNKWDRLFKEADDRASLPQPDAPIGPVRFRSGNCIAGDHDECLGMVEQDVAELGITDCLCECHADERAPLPQPDALDVERLAADAYKAGYEDGGQVYEHSNRDRYARAYGKRIAAEYVRLSQGDR